MMAAGETGLVGRAKKLMQEEATVPAPRRSQWGWLSSDRSGFISFRDDSSRVLGSPSFSENLAGRREHWAESGVSGRKPQGWGTSQSQRSMCWEPYATIGVLSCS